ncbi:hypothetical protein [Amycolatopsis sp. RTGN1]|uniref:hypothetical protein n=1 Tax=Amycolatopsis ponsaeliensis TaxID=2992142 RepID=UPI00254FBC8B|nr:hypothetical protein [Amycolatopsis sp. RTGN1]
MRKLSSIFLVGLCVGAIGAVAVTIGHGTAVPPKAIAVTEAVTTMSESPVASSPAPTPTPASTPGPSPKPESKVDPKVDAAELDRMVAGGDVSVVVFDRQAGATTVSVHADRGYTSASLVKLLIALAVLEQGGPVAQVQKMLSHSDDDLASRFWSAYGGPAIVTGWAKKIGLTGTRPPADPGRWGDTRITAKDVVRIYQYVVAHAPGAILAALRAASERGSDGFRQYFGIPDAAGGRPWAVKQGWSCCRPTRMLHTSGLVGEDDRYIVAVLSEHPASVDYATASKRVTTVVKAILG